MGFFRKQKGITFILLGFLLGVIITGGIFTGCNNKGVTPGVNPGESNPAPGEGALAAALPPLSSGNVVADIVSWAGPAVVKIETLVAQSGLSPFLEDPFFRQFFGENFPFGFGPRVQPGLGSGFIISTDGYILTNEHVIHDAREIQISVTGFDKPLPAKVVGSDYDLDLAILKVEAPRSLPTLKMGNSDAVRVGDWVVAIGNPYGLDHTVTVGVISAKGRPITIEDRHYENLLQTDASINPGNSGGPLLNLKGEVIGINTAINAQAQGIGFAIPTSTVQPVLQELLQRGKVARPWLGVYLGDLTPQIAAYLGLPKAEGALILEVQARSPAAKVGLKQGDVILKIDNEQVKNANEVANIIQKRKIGQTIDLLIFRAGKNLNITATIAEKP